MTPRSIRRAAERKARKAIDRKARNLASEVAREAETPAPVIEPRPSISPAQLAANRANARLSTGPKSHESKAKTCLNAVKTALTGRTVLLSSDDAAAYEQHVLAYSKELRPLTQRECDLVQSVADTAWRLKRIPALEMAIYAQGRSELAEAFHDHEPAIRPGLIELKTFLTYEKQLRNLQLQESRLGRRYTKDTAELRQIQAERKQRETIDLDSAAQLYVAAQQDHKPFHPEDYGFEFSTAELDEYLEGVQAANLTRASMQAALARAKSNSQAA